MIKIYFHNKGKYICINECALTRWRHHVNNSLHNRIACLYQFIHQSRCRRNMQRHIIVVHARGHQRMQCGAPIGERGNYLRSSGWMGLGFGGRSSNGCQNAFVSLSKHISMTDCRLALAGACHVIRGWGMQLH